MRKAASIASLILICSVSTLIAQNKLIDSLKKQLAGTLPDTVRAMSMMQLAVGLETIDTAASIRTYDDAIRFSLKNKTYFEGGRIYYNKSFVLTKAGRFEEAKICLDSALLLLSKSTRSDVSYRKAQVYAELGNLMRHLDDYQKALDYYSRSTETYLAENRLTSLISNYINTSTLYKMMNDFVKQEEYARKALDVAKQLKTKGFLFDAYQNIAFSLIMQEKFREGIVYIDSARAYRSGNISYERIVSHELIAGLGYLNLKQFDSAYACFKRSRDLAASVQDIFSTIQSDLQLAHVMVRQNKIREAEPLLLEQYKKIQEHPETGQLVVALDYLSDLYEHKAEYNKGLEYYKLLKQVSDSISSEANKKYASGLEITYKTKLKDAEILQQQDTIRQKSRFNNVLLFGSFLLLAVLVLLYRNFKQKKKLQETRILELEAEKKLLATEAILKGEEQERSRLARDLHDGLGGMLSGIKYSLNSIKGNLVMSSESAQALDKSIDMLNGSIQEMRRVAHNMMPEALVKFGLDTALQDFCEQLSQSGSIPVTYQSVSVADQKIEQTTALNLYRIIQELVNNSIKHANPGTVLVQVIRNGNKLSVTVEDDGKGFETGNPESYKGMGWQNIRNRVNFLKGELDLVSKPGGGTSVLISINL